KGKQRALRKNRLASHVCFPIYLHPVWRNSRYDAIISLAMCQISQMAIDNRRIYYFWPISK
ncbi:MAG: hypothetical protein KDE46_27000, partial [Caldilineaceae bacterium]|nr:hypothetical protein [Caldilineaceae bacterium]